MSDKSKRDVDMIPAIKPAQDEVASFRRSTRSEAPKQSNFNGVLVFVIVLMVILMGVGGFALWEVQKKLDYSNDLLAKSQEKINDLEIRLSDAGSNASQQFKSMESQLKTNVSEIDKLWGVAYRTNKPAIAANTKSIDDVKARLDKDLKQLTTGMTKVTNDFQNFSREVTTMRQNLLSENQEALTQMSLVRGQVQDQSVKVEGNRREVAALQKKMAEVDESIKTFDRYRQQVNQRIMELQNQVQPAPPP